MAKNPERGGGGTYSSTTKEREGFLRDLHHFHETRGTPFRRAPLLGGKEVDLHLLYTVVTAQGGWIKVNSKNGWVDILDQLRLPKDCVNASVALKQIYLRHLDRWEKVHFLGEEADRGSDDDEESRHKRWSARSLHSVPLSYNYNQHSIAEANRDYNHLSTDLYKASDYDKLALSLISPLPNEQDFAINVCTLISNDGKHTLKLEKHPRIVDYLLAHAGVFSHSSLRKIFVHTYSSVRKHPLHKFWSDVLEWREFLDLADENPPSEQPQNEQNSESNNDNENDDSDCEVLTSDTECGFKVKLRRDSTDSELFSLGRTLGTQDVVGQRILQIATILRNLSFIEENIVILIKNQTFIRFLLLCSSSRWNFLRNLGLDMLGNVASEFLVKNFPDDRLAVVLLKIVAAGLQSEDRASCISSLEALNKLSQNEMNEDVLLRYLEREVYEKVCSFLTIHDVMLLIYTLECLYSLSSLGEKSCNYIVGNHGVIDTIVSLVTVEGKSYGPKACIGMKLVETVPGGVTTAQGGAAASNSTSNSSTTITATSTTVKSGTATPTKSGQTLRSVSVASSTTTTTVTPVVTSQSQNLTPQQSIQQQHAHQQAIHENEQFALAWLRATYEPCTSSKIEHQELYKHYLNSCSKIGRRGVISPLHFPRCVRSVFGGTVGPNPLKPSIPSEPQYYEGIKVRPQPLIINITQPQQQQQEQMHQVQITSTSPKPVVPPQQQTPPTSSPVTSKGKNNRTKPSTLVSVQSDNSNDSTTTASSPASPILKAQLSAPPKQRDSVPQTSTTKGDNMKSQVMAHPHLSQALLGSTASSTLTTINPQPMASTSKETIQQLGQNTSSNTSLIKTLLATKVNDCMSTTVSMKTATATDCQNVAQVAARQQQQRLLAQQGTTTPTEVKIAAKPPSAETPKTSRLNGARQLFPEAESDSSVSSTTQFTTLHKSKKEPPQPPPPLAPLSNNNNNNGGVGKKSRFDTNEDSDNSTGNSVASSGMGTTGLGGGMSSTEEGDNSLTSFEGLLNGIPNIENPIMNNDDSNSKDSIRTGEITKNKPLRLADLLEKKVDKTPPILNGSLGKELRSGGKSVDLLENHIEKALSSRTCPEEVHIKEEEPKGVKRPASDDIVESEPKKPNVNGNVDSSSSNGDETTATVSTAAAKLFADMAADIMKEEDEEMIEANTPAAPATSTAQTSAPLQQIMLDNNQQVLLTPQTRQIIVSQQPQMQNKTVIVQNANAQNRSSVVLQQNPILLSQGQVQLGQYVLQTSGTQQAYMVPQTAMVHGQPQTVLVAQTAQQQGSGTKTIIILQQQTGATQHQKVVVTPQGQQVVVTQVHRPMLQSSTVTNNAVATVIKAATTSNGAVTAPAATTVTVEKKEEEKPAKPKIIRDLTTPFVCEWGECNLETKFKSANQVYMHVCEAHCPQGSEEIMCQWDRCDNMKRKRFSLMTHLHDKHCNTEAMKQSLTRRKQVSQGGKVEPAPATPTNHPGYAPDAALHAIKRHALEFVNPKELQDDNEGPVTKSIRLTASLILRNLVIYSSHCRRYLKHYEPHLANVALSNVESSRTIAQVLYDMNEGSNHR